MNDSDRLWDELCCCGDDHKVKEGGSHINLVQLKKLAKWPYMTAMNFLVSGSEDYPLANAVVCDRCLDEKREIKYAIGGRDDRNGHAEYFRVPIEEMEEPEFYWPDHHPDNKPLVMQLANGKTVEVSQDEVSDFITQLLPLPGDRGRPIMNWNIEVTAKRLADYSINSSLYCERRPSMKHEKAIELLDDLRHGLDLPLMTDEEDAIKLGIEALKQGEILKQVADGGLFIARLNNGDWMVGKGTHIYHLEITQDHYADPNVSIASSLGEAVASAIEKLGRGTNGTRESKSNSGRA